MMVSMQPKPLKKNCGVVGTAIRGSQNNWETGETQNQTEPLVEMHPKPWASSRPSFGHPPRPPW